MSTAVAAPELVVTAWSALSPYGVGAEAFGAGVLAGRSALADPAGAAGPYPRAGMVPGFTPKDHLGRRGTRAMDRLTGLAVSAVGLLVTEGGPGLTDDLERVGLVLGTGSGSAQSIMDFTTESLVGDRPYLVDPAQFPNTVMNKAAGQSAIWHGLRGPNTTITGDWLTGLLALSYASRLLRNRRCDRVLVGAVEECTPQRGWLEWHAGGDGEARPALGEGGAAFLLEPAGDTGGRTPLAVLRSTRFRAAGDDLAGALAVCVDSALADAGVGADQVRVAAPLLAVDGAERAALRAALGDPGPRVLDTRALIGDTTAAAAGFQVAAVLAALAEDGGTGLVTSVGRDRMVGAAVLEAVR
ncbi:beta-ketoacyl synthase N-terminal-like domain-containing protein [Actinokineospora bangkokensis]|uniref:Beta-ketoacyl synthase-like N-terminal domain-containing protein n=1 Tax=Actinokineospora bangkokensis TaxID=1193682 RepID=A0A1Q9LIR8_9PSEU|nr:beta-ketoacyl synthase N-terminal-like domain-containing protein [Actinokineospora bangkokensis]OLR91928.1 hypothetical protein BJP25_24175 [Actinokineospora bangkokensis]